MKVKASRAILVVSGLACGIILSACEASGGVRVTHKPSGNEITAEIDVRGTFLNRLAPEAVLDANNFYIDTSQSAALLSQASGTIRVTLTAQQMPVATETFVWVKRGTSMILSDPAAANAWIAKYPQADGYKYSYKAMYSASSDPKIVTSDYNGSTVIGTIYQTNAVNCGSKLRPTPCPE